MLRPQIAAGKTSEKQFINLSTFTKRAGQLRNTTAKPIRYVTWTLKHACSLSSQKSNQYGNDTNGNVLEMLFDYEKAYELMNRNMLISKVVEMGLHGNILIPLPSDFRCNLQQVHNEETMSRKQCKQQVLLKETNYHLSFLVLLLLIYTTG